MKDCNNRCDFYFDYAASTPVDAAVAQAMMPYMSYAHFGNPSASHSFGFEGHRAIEKARATIAKAINAEPDEIIFTSGATEANNIVFHGLKDDLKASGRTEIITSPLEHRAVSAPLAALKEEGFVIREVKTTPCGMADGPDILAEITDDTGLISIQAVQNELGVINPLEEVRDAAGANRDIIFHSDAAQGLGRVPLDVKALGLDCMTLSSHKIYGPCGIGALYIRKDLQARFKALHQGSPHEKGLRPGTLPTALIVGFAKAVEIAMDVMEQERETIWSLREAFLAHLDAANIHYEVNGYTKDKNWQVPHILSIRFLGIENEWLKEGLSDYAFSTASACASLDKKEVGTGKKWLSNTLMHIGGGDEAIARETLRLSLGRMTSEASLQIFAHQLACLIQEIGQEAQIHKTREAV